MSEGICDLRFELIPDVSRKSWSCSHCNGLCSERRRYLPSRMRRSVETSLGNLYGVGSSDPTTLCSAIGLLVRVALLAAWIPAHRAMKVDPIVAVRDE